MKKENFKTDDVSFGLYLNKLDHNSLIEHAIANMFPPVIADIILEHEHMQKDCMTIILKSDISLPSDLRKKLLAEELAAKSDGQLIDLMCLLFSKKIIINMFIEYMDEDARLNLIENNESWKRPAKPRINYN
jgi:hypothetical protein